MSDTSESSYSNDFTCDSSYSNDFICYMCEETKDLEYQNFQCKKCYNRFCEVCNPPQYEDDRTCTSFNCYYCSRGHCFNNRTNGYYCEDCVPEEKLKEMFLNEYHIFPRYQNERISNKIKQFQNEEYLRQQFLTNLLRVKGLVLRNDSKYCDKYIKLGEGNPTDIINRMCEMKFLFDYRDMQKILDKLAKELIDDRNDFYERLLEDENENHDIFERYYPKFKLFEEAERRATPKTGFPRIWPWIEEKNAKIIQKHCYNWLWKPVTKDKKIGINARLGMKNSGLGDFLYETDIKYIN
jgi:hypothetical protein